LIQKHLVAAFIASAQFALIAALIFPLVVFINTFANLERKVKMTTHRVMWIQEEGSEQNVFEGSEQACRDWINENRDDYPEARGFNVERIIDYYALAARAYDSDCDMDDLLDDER
jgi:hypothetical protein